MGSAFRHPRTTAEKRLSSDPEVAPFVRAKRRAGVLPDAYSDIPRTPGRARKPRYKDHRDGR
jgi:hypothetical protein